MCLLTSHVDVEVAYKPLVSQPTTQSLRFSKRLYRYNHPSHNHFSCLHTYQVTPYTKASPIPKSLYQTSSPLPETTLLNLSSHQLNPQLAELTPHILAPTQQIARSLESSSSTAQISLLPPSPSDPPQVLTWDTPNINSVAI